MVYNLGEPPNRETPIAESAELARTVREDVLRGFERVFGMDMGVLEIDVGVTGEVESQIFPEECDQKLRERLEADSRRQLELVRRR